MMSVNPYEPVLLSESGCRTVAFRTPMTLVHAVLLGLTIATICPMYLSAGWYFWSKLSVLDSFTQLLKTYLRPSIFAIAIGLFCGSIVPSRLSRLFSPYRNVAPLVINSMLFSAMFSLLGYQYLNGSLMIFGDRVSMLTIFNSVVVGTATFLHLACRPAYRNSSDDAQETKLR